MAKREDPFYTKLKINSAAVVEASEKYAEIIREYPKSIEIIPSMKVMEGKADELTGTIMEDLYTSFITPFDRGDLSDLTLALDEVVDAMHGVIIRLDLFNVKEMRKEALEMAGLLVNVVQTMDEMINALPDYKNNGEAQRLAMEVSRGEDVGDEVYQRALRRLFHSDVDGKTSVTWLRLFDRMEGCLDACNDVASIVRRIIMKSA